MIELLKKELQPARNILGTSPGALTANEIKEALGAIVNTLQVLTEALEEFERNSRVNRVVELPQDHPGLIPPPPGLTPNPRSSSPTELNPAPENSPAPV